MSQPSTRPALYKGYRFPPAIISHCVWLYFRLGVSLRDISEVMPRPFLEEALLKGLLIVPRAIVTDRLTSYAAAKASVLPTVTHLRRWRQNHRAENSHQSVRRRERGLQRFKSLRPRASVRCLVRSATSFGRAGTRFRRPTTAW